MTTEHSIPTRQRAPWNRGRLIGQKRPLKPKDVWTIRVRLQLEGRKRDLAMFNLAIDSKLRGCDLVRLRIDDVFAGGEFAIAPQSFRRRLADRYSSRSLSRPALLSASGSPPSTLARADICSQAVCGESRTCRRGNTPASSIDAGLDSSVYGTHSLRRTKPAQIYKKTGNLRAVQLLLGHTKLESTVRYLGIEVDDALAISEQVEL